MGSIADEPRVAFRHGAVTAYPLSLIWLSPDGDTITILDPDPKRPKPHMLMNRWERALLRAVLSEVLRDLDEVDGAS